MKMLQDNENNFDLQLKSMLQDASVTPSRRVWKGVSAALEGSSAPAAAWWKWAGAGLAFAGACALAATLFFRGTSSTVPESVPAAGHVTLVAEAVAEPESLPEAPAAAPAEVQKAMASVRSSRTYLTYNTYSEPEQAAVQAAGPEAPAAPAAPAVETEARAEAADAVWTLPDEEKSGFKPKVSLQIDGLTGSNDGELGNSLQARSHLSPGSSSPTGLTETSTSEYGIPFSAGVGVRVRFSPKFSAGIGVDWSLLTRTFTGKYQGEENDVLHTMHYIGIPLNVYYDLLGRDSFSLYAYAGGEAAYCISNKYTVRSNPEAVLSSPVNGLQWSVRAGLGAEFALGRTVSLYVDPGVSYYFNCDQPKSIRTDRPLNFNVQAGLRFNL